MDLTQFTQMPCNDLDASRPWLPAESAEMYSRHKISPGIKNIRLLHLLPGEEWAAIKCTLSVVSLEQQDEPFEALSYAWGDRKATRTIYIDGSRHTIATNLFIALANLRYPDRQRTLWIDAISINQRDISERNDQVRIMGTIYSRAIRVLVWLGEETGQSRAAFELLSTAYLAGPNARRRPMDDEDWHVMRDLYERDYWNRVWIVQEVCLAREAVILCGRRQIPWSYVSQMRKARSHVWTQYLSDAELGFRQSLMARLDWIRDMWRTKGCTLWTLLESFRLSCCEVVHDKIYGFLGLSSDCQDDDLPIDYSKSVQQLFEDVVLYHYRKFQDDKSSPRSAQLMAFVEFLQRYLRNHAAYSEDLETRKIVARVDRKAPKLAVSAFIVLQVERTASKGEEFGKSKSVLPGLLINGYNSSNSSSFNGHNAIDYGQTAKFGSVSSHATLEASIQSFRLTANHTLDSSKQSSVIASYGSLEVTALVPQGTEIGDLLCVFIDSHVVLAFRRVERAAGDEFTLHGKAIVDVKALNQELQLKGRLDNEKAVELTVFSHGRHKLAPWPATVYLDLFDLQRATDPTIRALPSPEPERSLEHSETAGSRERNGSRERVSARARRFYAVDLRGRCHLRFEQPRSHKHAFTSFD